jgi:hypothetical protein
MHAKTQSACNWTHDSVPTVFGLGGALRCVNYGVFGFPVDMWRARQLQHQQESARESFQQSVRRVTRIDAIRLGGTFSHQFLNGGAIVAAQRISARFGETHLGIRRNSFWGGFGSGLFAALASILIWPLEQVRWHRISRQLHSRSLLSIARDLGPRGCFTGSMRYFDRQTNWAVRFGLVCWMEGKVGGESRLLPWQHLACGVVAGIIAGGVEQFLDAFPTRAKKQERQGPLRVRLTVALAPSDVRTLGQTLFVVTLPRILIPEAPLARTPREGEKEVKK